MSELEQLQELKHLVGEWVNANFAHGVGTISAYVKAKDALVTRYLSMSGKTPEDMRANLPDNKKASHA